MSSSAVSRLTAVARRTSYPTMRDDFKRCIGDTTKRLRRVRPIQEASHPVCLELLAGRGHSVCEELTSGRVTSDLVPLCRNASELEVLRVRRAPSLSRRAHPQ